MAKSLIIFMFVFTSFLYYNKYILNCNNEKKEVLRAIKGNSLYYVNIDSVEMILSNNYKYQRRFAVIEGYYRQIDEDAIICAIKDSFINYELCVYAPCISKQCNDDIFIDCDACITWHFFLRVDSGTYNIVALPIGYVDSINKKKLDSLLIYQGCYYNKALYTKHLKGNNIEFKQEDIRVIYPVRTILGDTIFLGDDCWYCECYNENIIYLK